MNFSEFLLDETIKLYVDKNKANGDRALNFSKIAKYTGSSVGGVWKQIKKGGLIRAETFFKLVSSMENLDIDESDCTLIIKVSNSPENKNILFRFKNGFYKENYHKE